MHSIDKQHLFLKLRTAGSVLCLLLNCKCLGLNTTEDPPSYKGEPPIYNNTNQQQPPQPSAPPYEEVKNGKVQNQDMQNGPVTPPPYPGLIPPPPYEAAPLRSYEKTMAPAYQEMEQPPSYEEAIAAGAPKAKKAK